MYTMRHTITAAGYYLFLKQYGIIVLLCIMDRFEREQNYEECHKIKLAIHAVEELYHTILPTKLDDKAVEIVKQCNPEIGFKIQSKGTMIFNANILLSKITVPDKGIGTIKCNQIFY